MGLFDAFKRDPWEKLQPDQRDMLILFNSDDPKTALSIAQEIFGRRKSLAGNNISDAEFRKLVISCRKLRQEFNWSHARVFEKIHKTIGGALDKDAIVKIYTHAIAHDHEDRLAAIKSKTLFEPHKRDQTAAPKPQNRSVRNQDDSDSIMVNLDQRESTYKIKSSSGKVTEFSGTILSAILSGAKQAGYTSLDHIFETNGAMKVLSGRYEVTAGAARHLATVLEKYMDQPDIPKEFSTLYMIALAGPFQIYG